MKSRLEPAVELLKKHENRLLITQKNTDGAYYSTGSINTQHEVVSGSIINSNTGEILLELSAAEVIDLFH